MANYDNYGNNPGDQGNWGGQGSGWGNQGNQGNLDTDMNGQGSGQAQGGYSNMNYGNQGYGGQRSYAGSGGNFGTTGSGTGRQGGQGGQGGQGYSGNWARDYGTGNWGGSYGTGGSGGRTSGSDLGNVGGWSYTEVWLIPGPHSGKGPQGYQRSDDRIKEDVCERLTQHGQIDAQGLSVDVNNGEVTLAGQVHTRQEKRMAEDVAEQVSGVKDVHNQLRINSQGGDQHGQNTQQEHQQAH